jgi:acetylornithine deacetylase/succinyl-diaminopimelate desuccinylase-like protein
MVELITSWLTSKNIEHYVDDHLNVYATKQNDPTIEYFPCVVSHTDTVHNLDSINVREEDLPNTQKELKLALKAYNDHGQPTGIGGDDKAGVFACLTLLDELPNLKAAFFVSEETGCHGSGKADPEFFKNVGYVIEFDAPENWMVTEYCFGQQLFDRESEFFEVADKILTEGMKGNQEYMVHPYTDVYALRGLFDFQCINFSIGYYNYHTPYEYVVIEDVFNGIEMGREMINTLGYKLYHKPKGRPKYHGFLWD